MEQNGVDELVGRLAAIELMPEIDDIPDLVADVRRLLSEVDRLRADAALGAAVRTLLVQAALRHCTPCSDDTQWWHVVVDDADAVGGVRYYGATTPGNAIDLFETLTGSREVQS
jgi:hypothetical protein